MCMYKSKATRDGILSAIVIGTVLAAVTLGVAAAYAAGPTAALLVAEGARWPQPAPSDVKSFVFACLILFAVL
jgi:hypothetical protein